jgi:hypothetical protein
MRWGFGLVSSSSVQSQVARCCEGGGEPPTSWMARNFLLHSFPPLGLVPGYFNVFLGFTPRFLEMRLNTLLPRMKLYFRPQFYKHSSISPGSSLARVERKRDSFFGMRQRRLSSVELLGRGHTILTSRELMWCYACSLNVRGDLTLNSMAQIHTSVSTDEIFETPTWNYKIK